MAALAAWLATSASEAATLRTDGEAVSLEGIGTPIPGRQSVSFGDSYTTGFGASAADRGYVNHVSVGTDWGLRGNGLPGKQIQDICAGAVYPTQVTPGSRFTTLTGFNDMRFHGLNETALGTYRRTLLAALSWLAIPHAQRRMANHPAITYAGTWAGAALYYGTLITQYSGEAGATARTTVEGTTIYVGYTCRAAFGWAGRFSVTVDGVERATVDTGVGLNSGQPDWQFWPEVTRIAGLAPGAHEVVVTVLPSTGETYVNLDWIGGNGGLDQVALPLVLAGNTMRLGPAGYAQGAARGYNKGSDAAVALYNEAHRQVCADLRADGLHVVPVDAAASYDPQNAQYLISDLVHPSDAGHAAIARSFLRGANAGAREWGVAAIDPGTTAARVEIFASGAYGTVAESGGRLTYTPGRAYAGRDAFTYTVVYPRGPSAIWTEPAPFPVEVAVRGTTQQASVLAESGTPVVGRGTAAYGPARTREAGAFLGTLREAGRVETAIFAGDGAVRLEVGGEVPGLAGATLRALGAPSGQAALVSVQVDPAAGVTSADDQCLLGGLNGVPRVAAREGQALSNAPGLGLGVLRAFDGNGADVFFFATLRGPRVGLGNDLALCVARPDGSVRVLVREGQEVNGRRVTTIVSLVGSAGTLAEGRWRVGSDGIGARLSFSDGSQALYVVPADAATPDDWRLLIRTGDLVDGARLTAIGMPGFGPGGAAFVGTLLRAAPQSRRETAVVFAAGGTPLVLARVGSRALDAAGNPLGTATYASFGEPVVGAGRRVAFAATLRGAPAAPRGFWFSPGGNEPRLLARLGDAAPLRGRWAALTSLVLPNDPDAGPVITGSLAVSPAVPAAARHGLWVADANGSLQPLLRSDDPFDLASGPARLLSFDAVSVGAGSVGSSHGVDESGLVSVLGRFEGGRSALIRVAAP